VSFCIAAKEIVKIQNLKEVKTADLIKKNSIEVFIFTAAAVLFMFVWPT
jgi:hypothetical protein